jgi:hypothetical protein
VGCHRSIIYRIGDGYCCDNDTLRDSPDQREQPSANLHGALGLMEWLGSRGYRDLQNFLSDNVDELIVLLKEDDALKRLDK